MDSLRFLVQAGPALLATVALLAAVHWLAAPGRWLARWVPAPGGRLEAVDGLRGFLALAVVLCHIATFEEFLGGQAWGPHPNPYFRQAGAASVRLFFMITGFLFWSKALRSGGRLPAWPLVLNRFWRIMPLYLALIAALAAWSLVRGDGLLKSPPGQVLLECLRLLPPGFFPDQTINGLDTTHLLRQSWTLRWEWLYYLSLPLLAMGLRSRRAAAALAVAGLMLAWLLLRLQWLSLSDWSVFATFGIGMTTAWVVQRWPAWAFARTLPAQGLALLIVLATPLAIHRGHAVLGNLLYGGLFVLIVYGNSLFGLLHLRGSRLLGETSYSIYLLHMVVLTAWMAALQAAGWLSPAEPLRYWACMGPSLFAVAALSLLTFVFIERPGIDHSRRVRAGRAAAASIGPASS